MRINDRDIGNESLPSAVQKSNASAAYAAPAKQAGTAPAATVLLADDSAAFSSAGSLVSHTMALPELNAARVNDVQAALASGHFQVDSSSVATALIRTMLDGAWS